MRLSPVAPLLAFVVCTLGGTLHAQTIDMASVSASEDFRSGVQAYHNGLFNKSILYLEKALSENPNDVRTKDWLGRAYYRSGFTQNALDIWQSLIDSGKASALLQTRVAMLKARRGLGKELSQPTKYVVAHQVQGVYPKYTIFQRPTAVTPTPDGGFYVVSFATSEVDLLDANGGFVRKIRPGLGGYNHPYDLIAPGNGYIYVSDYGSNQIVRSRPDGGQVKRFGAAGIAPGQLLGPEYLAADDSGYIFVTDVGNRRVTKFDYDGKYILSFGEKTDGFDGLGMPSGVAVYDNKVFVADHQNKDIVVFDTSGNYLTTIGDGLFQSPEGISFIGDQGDLVVSDGNRIVMYNVDTQASSIIADLSGSAQRIVKTVEDANGDLIAADFDASSILVLSQLGSTYAGLAVQIDRVYADDFPKVTINVSVQSRLGEPFTGLDADNFVITEGGYPVGNPHLVFTGMQSSANLSILIDRSAAMESRKQDIQNGVTSILDALKGHGAARIVSAGANPVVEAEPNVPGNRAARLAAESGQYGDTWRFDLGLRLATSELIPKQGKSAVVFITQGNLGTKPFQQYTSTQLLQFLQANGISLYCVYVDQSAGVSKELQYLSDQSGGKTYYLYRPQGIASIVGDILAARDGSYVLQYVSHSQSDFGRSFLPVEVEAHLFSRSGRDEAGYFAPLQF